MEPDIEKVIPGYRVEINLTDRDGNKEQLGFIIVAAESADFSHGFLGENTPLAQAILGEKVGCIIPYLKNDIFAIEILSVAPSSDTPPTDISEKRQRLMEKTIREVEHTNAVVFASSFSGKWGDYDPDSLPEVSKPDQEEPEG